MSETLFDLIAGIVAVVLSDVPPASTVVGFKGIEVKK